MKNLLPNTKIIRVANNTAAGTTDVVGTVVDMQGYRGALCIALLGTLTATQVTKLIAEQSADNAVADPYALIGTTPPAADGDGDKLLVLEISEPNDRYLRFTVDRGTANAQVNGMIVILYNAALCPVTADATVALQALFASPNEP